MKSWGPSVFRGPHIKDPILCGRSGIGTVMIAPVAVNSKPQDPFIHTYIYIHTHTCTHTYIYTRTCGLFALSRWFVAMVQLLPWDDDEASAQSRA